MSIIIAVLILIIIGGGIAFAGDRIGSYVGKKRLSVFKLRPRDTARLFTISFGALIALITFLSLILIDHNFLIALQRGAELIRSNSQLQKQNKKLVVDSQNAQSQMASALADRQSAEQQLNSVNTQLRSAKEDTLNAQNSLKSVQSKLTQDQLEVASLQSKAQVLVASNAQAALRLNKTVKTVQSGIQGTLIYRSQEEVDRIAIKTGQPLDQTKRDIYSFLLELNKDSHDRGGKGIQLVTIGIGNQTVTGEQVNVDALAQNIHDGKLGRVAVIANAVGNAYADQPVTVMLHPYADRLAIPGGSEIAQLTIPATDSQNPTRVLSDLQGLLEIAKSNAIRAGMIPLANPQIGSSELIKVKVAELYQVYDLIRVSTGPSVVTVVVPKDTYASQHPLDVMFTVNGLDVNQVY